MVVFRGASDTPTPLAFLLPLLMIAAVRFGSAGAGISFLALTLVAIWAGTYRKGPFADLPQVEAVLALQLYLTVLAIPIYAVASLIEERRRARRAVDEQLQFQQTLSSLTAAFVHLPETDIDGAIQRWLPRLAASLRLETLTVHERAEAAEGSGGETVTLVAGGRTLGVLAATRRPRAGPRHEELTERLQLVAEVFANALARREAERALQRSRAELAHFNRVSTMGELAASLAHELRQPLSGILTNAQAALRFLQAANPPLDEVREAMHDIVEDERRAAAVIQRLRDLLSKREPSRVLLDLNGVIRSVAGMVGSDAVIRRVEVSLQLAREPIPVRGDRIQLEQVILNLMFNGLEAMSDCADRERILLVQTRREDSRAEMTVMDAGAGLPAGSEERVFEPFFTTKPAGMGMGLSIARSIAESHGGTLRAANNPTHGATFRLVLPLNQS
jgi:C4-dicarboxylate-specific signal transduction histidine kinase